MATITRENIGVLNDKIMVKIAKEDYFPSFEKSLKNYSKSASIPGFRKGMVPAGIIKKMHGQSVFTDEVLRTVEKELMKYMETEKLDIFAQPLPLAENDARQLDVNNPVEYTFGFEVGLKPEFKVADLSAEKVPFYKVAVTDEMINEQIERLRKAYGKKINTEGGDDDENIEKAELNEEFFKTAYPGKDIKTEEELREELKKEIEGYWEGQSRNQMQHEVYHRLLDHSEISFPENFLKRWMENNTEQPKSKEEVEKEYPNFMNQLKWTLINDRIGADQKLDVTADDIKDFAKKQLFGYMGMQTLGEEQPWVEEYLNKMMQDRKFIDDSYNRIRTEKLFGWAEGQVQKEEKAISADDFTKMIQEHQHQH
jgi:FKBP-type peptidyl-prolyl cis-trans isomerase (trigger factor)